MIYLDYSATTPVDKRVLNTFNKVCLEYPGNSNSLHKLGVEAKELENFATGRIKELLSLDDEDVIYTSGASESNNHIIKGVCSRYQNRGKHIITTYLEHSSVLECMRYMSKKGFDVDYVRVLDDGRVDLEHLKSLLRHDTILVSICLVDSEMGIRQPIGEINSILSNYPKCFFHVDCTQGLGKIPIDFHLMDFASVSLHKVFGMKGIGLLIKKKGIVIDNLVHGGKSSTVYRSGTPALPLIVSSMKALDLVMGDIESHYRYVESLHDKIIHHLKKYSDVYINSTVYSICYVINFSILSIKPETMIHAFDEYNIYLSTKSACSTSALSDAVYAVVKDRDRASSSIRVSLSYKTTKEDVDEFLRVFDIVYHKLNIKR